jgi:hypothetical protein
MKAMADAVKGPVYPLEDLRSTSLDDKYDLSNQRIFVSEPQAIVRLLLMQKELDRRNGLNTAGFVSGYHRPPLGGLDLTFLSTKRVLDAAEVLFQPGLSEDLAVTAVWSAQQAEMRGEDRFDGVFALWYGKGPGIDRSGDVLRHANLAGTSKYGGVLALMGDDHTAESSTTAHQSEFNFVNLMIPILSPAGVREIIDYGLYGYAMSQFTGAWVGLKCLKDTVESSGSIDVSLDRVRPVVPTGFLMPEGSLNIRTGDSVLEQEKRLHNYKRDAMLAWLRANRLNKIITSGGSNAKIGVITAGKSYLGVRQAMDDLGIDEVAANRLGLRLMKLACTWPIEPQGLHEFARGLELIIIIEEKRSLIEVQLREELYGSPSQPVCVGKKDEEGFWLFPITGSLDPNDIAIAIGRRLLRFVKSSDLETRVRQLERAQATDCNDCGEKPLLPAMAQPIQFTRDVQTEVESQRRAADQRTRFVQAISRLPDCMEQKTTPPQTFISYAWGVPEHEQWVEKKLAPDLQKAGINVVLDRWHNAEIGASVSRFVERIEKSDRIVIVGTPAYRRKYENKDTSPYVVAAEVDLINIRLLGTEPQKQSVLPLLLKGEKADSLPPLLHGRVYADFRDEHAYFATAFELIRSLYRLPPNHPAVVDLRELLRERKLR